MTPQPDGQPSRAFDWAAYCLGFAMGGFFDGILLHQILQWHHLLSAIQTGPFSDLRGQVMADGLFHALMYVIGTVGIALLYRCRTDLSRSDSSRRLLANASIAFGAWHVVDAVLSHWLIGIHRIRMDSPTPLWWDLAWLSVFGIVPLLLGVWFRRRGRPPHGGRSLPGASAAMLLILASVSSGAVALFPIAGGSNDTVTVVLRPDVPASRLLNAMTGTDVRVLWSDGDVWVLRATDRLDRFYFYRHGAMYVSGSGMPVGCSGWFRTTVGVAS